MSGREAFGPNLRRARLRRGISLQQIASDTNVSEVLWAAMEKNDFSRWPNGIFARAYIRDYAKMVGLDPEATVDEFCRWFPQGDRRADRQIRGQAEIINHPLESSQGSCATGGASRVPPGGCLRPAAPRVEPRLTAQPFRFNTAIGGPDASLVLPPIMPIRSYCDQIHCIVVWP
jgi:transcriptional regulator with XRE-family HTH domain